MAEEDCESENYVADKLKIAGLGRPVPPRRNIIVTATYMQQWADYLAATI